MKICPYCSAENDDKAARCSGCGSSLADNKISAAKTKLFDDSHFILEEGDQINNRYRIIRKLGEGGMGVVYLVEDMVLEKECALKLIHPELVSKPEALARFRKEVAISQEMAHDNIIRVFDLGWFDKSRLYFTMEYLQGATLAELLAQRKGELPPFDVNAIGQIMLPLLDGLAYAHKQGSIHRDMKPANVMVEGDFAAGETKIKILDFGIARTMSASRFTHTSQALGTHGYMAPEQFEDAHDIDHRADLYGCGMILYELLTGKRAMGRFSLPSRVCSPEYAPLDAVVETSLAPDPGSRYPDAAAMRAALASALDETEQELDEDLRLEREKEAEAQRKAEEEARKKKEQEEKISSLQNRLQSALNSRKWERALELCNVILSLDPENSVAAQARQSVDEGLLLEREKKAEEERKAAEAARRKKEREAEAKRKAEEEARKKREQEKKKEAEERKRAAGQAADEKEDRGRLYMVLALAVLGAGGLYFYDQNIGKTPVDEKPAQVVSADSNSSAERRQKEEAARQAEEQRRKRQQAAEKKRQEKIAQQRRAIGRAIEESQWSRAEQLCRSFLKKHPGDNQVLEQLLLIGRRQEEEQKKQRLASLTVQTVPANARVRILNIKPRYTPDMSLEPGRYHIEVSAPGYHTLRTWVEIEPGEAAAPAYELQKDEQVSHTPAPGSTWTDPATGMEFVYLEGGCFQMGSPDDEPERDDDEYQHEVCVDGFYMGRYEVSQQEWRKVMGNNPSWFKGGSLPVEEVNWFEAAAFANRLSRGNGHEECYVLSGCRNKPGEDMECRDVTVKEGCNGFRLPTEAEWEYAARAGTSTPFALGNCISTGQANYNGNYPLKGCPKGEYREKTWPVDRGALNGWGLYNMHGNVWEWCQDWYDKDYYKNSPRRNPQGPSSGRSRVVRGGGWSGYAGLLRSASRHFDSPGGRHGSLGFRLVRTP